MQTAGLTKGPEKVFIEVLNDSSATITKGMVLEFTTDDSTTIGSGVQVMQTAAAIPLLAGVAEGTIAVGAYGRAQIYGYHDSVVVYGHGTATNSNIAIGDIGVACSLGRVNWVAAGGAGTAFHNFVAMETVGSLSASSLSTTMKAFINCL
jgi:hypothetical protein